MGGGPSEIDRPVRRAKQLGAVDEGRQATWEGETSFPIWMTTILMTSYKNEGNENVLVD